MIFTDELISRPSVCYNKPRCRTQLYRGINEVGAVPKRQFQTRYRVEISYNYNYFKGRLVVTTSKRATLYT